MPFRVKYGFILATICVQAWAQATDSSPSSQSSAPSAQPSPAQTPPATQPSPPSAPTNATTQPTPPAPENAFTSSSVRLGGIDFSGFLDGYYSFNNNHPQVGVNQLYDFNDRTNQVDFNLGKLTLSRDPAPIGFRVDVGFGRTFEIEKTPHPNPEFYRFIEQSYISVKPKNWKGVEVDLGEFVTWAGAEVIETNGNWNYSRSLLFSWAIPFYHFGVRASAPIGSRWTVGAQVVNGWNAIVNNYSNNMKTLGLTAAYTRKKYTWTNVYYVGPEYTGVNDLNQNINRRRNVYDSVLLLTPTDKVSAYVNFDYGQQNLIGGSAHWVGIAGALHYQATKRVAFTPRVEWFDDTDGFATGTTQHLHEVTVTGEYKVVDGLLTRLEYRHDGSNVDFFQHGTVPASSKGQSTVTLGLIAYFPLKH
jgi:hypothetical protein